MNKIKLGLLSFLIGFLLILNLVSAIPPNSTCSQSYTHRVCEKDGRKTLTISHPKFYNNKTEKWEKINNNIKKGKTIKNKAKYEVNDNTYKLRVVGNKIRVKKHNVKVDFRLEQVKKVKNYKINNNTLIFNITNATVNLTVTPFSLDKLITIHNYSKDFYWREKFTYSHSFKNLNFGGEFHINRNLKIYDSNKNYYPLTRWNVTNNSISFKINQSWLDNASFPVYVDPSLIIDGVTTTMCGYNDTYDEIEIINGGVLDICDYDGTAGTGYVNISTTNFTVDSTSSVDGLGAGYRGGDGYGCGYKEAGESFNGTPGTGGGRTGGTYASGGYTYYGGGGGGAHGGNGGKGGDALGATGGAGGDLYDIDFGIMRGSGGGQSACPPNNAGDGGGFFKLNAERVNIQGSINVNGENGGSGGTDTGGMGGGAGGGIWLKCDECNLTNGIFNAKGGNGGGSGSYGGGGGGGAGGIIRIIYKNKYDSGFSYDVGGGSGGSSVSYSAGNSGGTGSLEYDKPPTYSNFNIQSPTIYDANTKTNISITWSDIGNNFDNSILETNITGSPVNLTNNITSYSKVLGAGSYYVKFYGNDSFGLFNQTQKQTFTISKASSTTNLYLNGSASDVSYEKYAIANLTGIVNPSFTAKLNLNATGWGNNFDSGVGSVENISNMSMSLGIYNLTAHFDGNQNYSKSSQTYFIDITDTGIPQYSNIKFTSPTPYYPNKKYQFNTTWTDNVGIDKVLFEAKNQNNTVTTKSGDEYYYNKSGSYFGESGVYNIKWYANDTSNNWNSYYTTINLTFLQNCYPVTPTNTIYDDVNITWNISCNFTGYGMANYSLPNIKKYNLTVYNNTGDEILHNISNNYINFTANKSASNYTIQYVTTPVKKIKPLSCPTDYTKYPTYCEKIESSSTLNKYYYRLWLNVTDNNAKNYPIHYTQNTSIFDSWGNRESLAYDINDSSINLSSSASSSIFEVIVGTSYSASSLEKGIYFEDVYYEETITPPKGGGGVSYITEVLEEANYTFKVNTRKFSNFLIKDFDYENDLIISNYKPQKVDVTIEIDCIADDPTCHWLSFSKNKTQSIKKITLDEGSKQSPTTKYVKIYAHVPENINNKKWYTANIILTSRDYKKVIKYEFIPLNWRKFFEFPLIIFPTLLIVLLIGGIYIKFVK